MKAINKIQLIWIVLLVLLGFCAGFFTSNLTGFTVYNSEDNLVPQSLEKSTPEDRIPESKIKVYEDKIILDIKNAEWSRFSDTHSMEPVLNHGTNAIEIAPKSESEIKVGDIVSYTSEYGIIIHRVIEKGIDEYGTYFILKGDNNKTPDPEKIRFNQIKRVLVAVIY